MKVVPEAPKRMSIKRFFLPFAIVGPCPKCGAEASRDFEREPDYLSYPVLDTPFLIWIDCAACKHEWQVTATLTVRLTLVPAATAKP